MLNYNNELESIQIQSDVGVETTWKIIDACRQEQQKEKYLSFVLVLLSSKSQNSLKKTNIEVHDSKKKFFPNHGDFKLHV